MGLADSVEKIIVELQQQGADKAYVGISRVDDIIKSLEKRKGPDSFAETLFKAQEGIISAGEAGKLLDDRLRELAKQQGPLGVVQGVEALNEALSQSLVQIPNLTKLTDQAAAAQNRLTDNYLRYEASLDKKRERNKLFTEAKVEAEAAEKGYKEALDKQDAFQSALKKEHQYNLSMDKKHQDNLHRMESMEDEKRYQEALRRQDKHVQKMRDGANPFGETKAMPRKATPKERAYQMVHKAFGPTGARGFSNTLEMLEKIGPVASKLGPPLATAAAAMGAVAIAGVGATIWAGKEFGGAVIGAQGFREDMLTALESIAGTEAKANSILDKASRTASFLGKRKGETVGQFTSLMGKGFDTQGADDVVRGMADLKVKAPKANIEQLVFAIGQIQTKGKLAGEELGQLAEGGIDRGAVLAILAKNMGKSAGDIEKAMQAGKISSKEGISAILGSINKNGGPLGALANKKSRSDITSLLDMVKAIPDDLFFDLKVGPGMDGVKSTINSVLDWFDVDKGKGKEVRQTAGDLFNAMVEGLTGNKIDTKKGIAGTLDVILAGAKEAVPVVRELAGGARDILGLASSVAGGIASITKFTGGLGNASAAWKGLSLSGRLMMAPLLGPLAVLPELYQGFRGISALLNGDTKGAKEHFMNMLPGGEFFGSFTNSMTGIIESLGAQISAGASNMWNAAVTYGSNLWQGMVQGISGGISAVAEAATNLANSALAAVGSTWRVGSPAREFFDLAMWAGRGTIGGFKRSEGGVYAAGAAMANAGLGGAWAAGQVNSNGGAGIVPMASAAGSGGVVINFSPTIIVSGANSPTQAQAIGAAAIQGARTQFEAQLGTAKRRLLYG